MHTAYVTVLLITVFANTFSGITAMARFAPVLPAMERVGVPVSLIAFPIGVAKAAGALGLLLGLLGVPLIGQAAAAGLVAYFLIAIGVHLRARDISPQFAAAILYLGLALASLLLSLAEGPMG